MSQPVTTLDASRYEQVCLADHVAALTPAEVREAMAFWVGRDRLDIAQVLVNEGLQQHPQSPDILAVGALLAEIQQDSDTRACSKNSMSFPSCWPTPPRLTNCRPAPINCVICGKLLPH